MPRNGVVEPAAVLRALAREAGLTQEKYDANASVLRVIFGPSTFRSFRELIEQSAKRLPGDRNLLAILVALRIVDAVESSGTITFTSAQKLEERRRSLALAIGRSERSIFHYEGVGAERLALMMRWRRGIERNPNDGLRGFNERQRSFEFWMDDSTTTIAAALTSRPPRDPIVDKPSRRPVHVRPATTEELLASIVLPEGPVAPYAGRQS